MPSGSNRRIDIGKYKIPLIFQSDIYSFIDRGNDRFIQYNGVYLKMDKDGNFISSGMYY